MGLEFLDRQVGGGLTAGTLLALVAPPQSQSQLILRQLFQARQTLYISTMQPEPEIEAWPEEGGTAPGLRAIRAEPETVLDTFDSGGVDMPAESFVIIDRANDLEGASRDTYLSFLNEFKSVLEANDSVGIPHC